SQRGGRVDRGLRRDRRARRPPVRAQAPAPGRVAARRREPGAPRDARLGPRGGHRGPSLRAPRRRRAWRGGGAAGRATARAARAVGARLRRAGGRRRLVAGRAARLVGAPTRPVSPPRDADELALHPVPRVDTGGAHALASLPMAYAYAAYVIVNLIAFTVRGEGQASPGWGSSFFGIVYALVAVGVSGGAAVVLSRRKAALG